jgi:hypothetical protein
VKFKMNKFDYARGKTLDHLIETKQIAQFYRPSEGKWTTPGIDPIRRKGGWYAAPERRSSK